MDASNKASGKEKIGIVVGGIVAVAGIATAGYLATAGHDVIASTIALPLATMIAMILGRKALR